MLPRITLNLDALQNGINTAANIAGPTHTQDFDVFSKSVRHRLLGREINPQELVDAMSEAHNEVCPNSDMVLRMIPAAIHHTFDGTEQEGFGYTARECMRIKRLAISHKPTTVLQDDRPSIAPQIARWRQSIGI